TDAGAPDWHPASADVKARCAEAAAACRRRRSSIAKLAVQFAVANRQIATTVVGTPRESEIRENVRWSQEPPDPELLAEVRAILQPVHNVTWPSGRPENN